MVENSLIVLETRNFITSTILENIIYLLPLTLLLVLHTHKNTDSNKLMIIFSINKKKTIHNLLLLLYIGL